MGTVLDFLLHIFLDLLTLTKAKVTMGNRNSQPPSEPSLKGRPADITKLNESVWELCATQGVPDVEIVFCHGLQMGNYEEAFWKTWLSRDGTALWPKDWLNASLREKGIQARILSISYDSCARRHPGEKGLYVIVENRIQDMIDDALIGQNCPVILVGHSLGGIIIKQLLLDCERRKNLLSNRTTSQAKVLRRKNFLDNCKGVLYYSTPHAGSRLADYAARIPLQPLSELVSLLKTLSTQTGRINNDFIVSMGNVGKGNLITRAIGESLDTTYMGFTARVVEDASARGDVEELYTARQADHFQVCKPTDNTADASFTFLVSLVNDVLETNMNPARDLPNGHNR